MINITLTIETSNEISREKALEIAKEFGLENEVSGYMECGYTPEEALIGMGFNLESYLYG